MLPKNILKYFPILLFVPMIYLVLIGSLYSFFDKNRFLEIITSQRILHALKLSIITATIVACVSTIIAIPTAYLLSRKKFYFKTVLDILIETPLVVSPAALGAMILVFLNTSAGRYIQNHFFPIVFSVNGIIIAQIISTVGIAIRLMKSIIDEVPTRYEDIAKTLGASEYQIFTKITIPLSIKGIFAAFILVWAKSIGEFGATITVAGTMPMKTETLPLAIYLYLSSADIEGTVVLIALSVWIGLLSLSIFRWLSHKSIYD